MVFLGFSVWHAHAVLVDYPYTYVVLVQKTER